jgi:adenosylcobinamide kinase / adenosylcobinamide-phosphate guanylyltransferase
LTLITGGAKSGKSGFAEKLALDSGEPVYYFATMRHIAGDAEQEERIRKLRLRRPVEWHTFEVEKEIEQAIKQLSTGDGICIVDCVSLYVANLFFQFEHRGFAGRSPSGTSLRTTSANARPRSSRFSSLENSVNESIQNLIGAIDKRSDKKFVVVTSEVGFGIVPDNETTRRFRDLLGDANQALARSAETVWLSCAGLQIKLK